MSPQNFRRMTEFDSMRYDRQRTNNKSAMDMFDLVSLNEKRSYNLLGDDPTPKPPTQDRQPGIDETFENFKIDCLKVSHYRRMTFTIFHTLNAIKQVGIFPEIAEENKIDFEFKKPGFNKLIIFDLDETLIHSLRQEDEEDSCYPYYFNEDERMDKVHLNHVELTDPCTQQKNTGGFFIRPFLREALQAVNTRYEVAIFTIATDWYANPIIDKIDPDGTLIQHRFYRQHARENNYQEGFLYKDLRIFRGVDLDKILIVDNQILSFCSNLTNGIPILDFEGQKQDAELKKLAFYLLNIADSPSLRQTNELAFNFEKIMNSKFEKFIKYY